MSNRRYIHNGEVDCPFWKRKLGISDCLECGANRGREVKYMLCVYNKDAYEKNRSDAEINSSA